MAIFWIVAALVALVVLYFWGAKRGSTGTKEPPEETLKRRFASGEIDEETYQRMLRTLRE
jgi:uncharacterized membrane protein